MEVSLDVLTTVRGSKLSVFTAALPQVFSTDLN